MSDEASRWFGRGAALEQVGQFRDAALAYRTALQLEPELGEAAFALGDLMLAHGGDDADTLDIARTSLARAVELLPGEPAPLMRLGVLYRRAGDVATAEGLFRAALVAADNSGGADDWAEAAALLAEAMSQRNDPHAVELAAMAVERAPQSGARQRDLATVLVNAGRAVDALRAYEAALAINPNDAAARVGLAMACLGLGDMARGWAAYESRFAMRGMRGWVGPPTPRWDGGDIAGRRLLVVSEQGAGDVVMFARFAAVLAARGARVTWRAPAALRRLLGGVAGIEEVAAADAEGWPEHDVWAPMLSLGGLLDVPRGAGWGAVPYLTPPAEAVAHWRQRLAGEGQGAGGVRMIGVAWSGSSLLRNNPMRSMSADDLLPLAAMPGVRLVSLQKPSDPAGVRRLWAIEAGAELGDFGDTAGLIAALDGVVTIDTSLANIAGAMGAAVTVLLPAGADWRWGHEATTPWYPTARLERRGAGEPWSAVVARAATRR